MFNIKITVGLDVRTIELLKRAVRSLEQIEESLEDLVLLQRPRLRPGMVQVISKGQISMSQFGYKFALPMPENPADVARRALVVTVNGATAT